MKCHVCRQGNLIRQQIGWSCDKCRVAVLSAVPRYRIYPMPFVPASVVETPDGEWVQWQDIQEEMTALRSAAEKLQALVAELTNELCIARSAVECPPLHMIQTPRDPGKSQHNQVCVLKTRIAALESELVYEKRTARQTLDDYDILETMRPAGMSAVHFAHECYDAWLREEGRKVLE